jgi:hypothetical protein
MTALCGIERFVTDPELLGPWFNGDSWSNWLTVLKGAFGEPLSESEHRQFVLLAEREPPDARVRELWCAIGRRAGKDSTASAIATYMATAIDWSPYLRPGERATILCLAVDRQQAALVFSYIAGYFDRVPMLGALVNRRTDDTIELEHVDIMVATCSYRSLRGKTVALAILDECAFWRPADGAFVSPDVEVYSALLPCLMTLRKAGALIIGISSVYRRAGLLYDKWQDHHGKPGDVLVIKAPSRTFNPTLDEAAIVADMALDPARGAAEWLSEWRNDIAAFVSREAVEAVIIPGRRELLPRADVRYFGFCDPAGGSGADAMTLAICHVEGSAAERRILDCIREWKPHFSPEVVVEEAAATLAQYGVTMVTGDRYAGDWPGERFRSHGIDYISSEKHKSEIYRAFLSILNSAQCELLDDPRLVGQLIGLETKTAWGGRQSIDHGLGGHDDLINAAAGALVLSESSRSLLAWRGML